MRVARAPAIRQAIAHVHDESQRKAGIQQCECQPRALCDEALASASLAHAVDDARVEQEEGRAGLLSAASRPRVEGALEWAAPEQVISWGECMHAGALLDIDNLRAQHGAFAAWVQQRSSSAQPADRETLLQRAAAHLPEQLARPLRLFLPRRSYPYPSTRSSVPPSNGVLEDG